jgi:ElaB/YqjD/DUF883 family membrane-anchored ribosome-binding protein
MSSSATDPGTRGSAEIERDVERSRARLSGTLDELRDRAQPGQLFEQVLDYAKQSGGADMARNLGQQMRDNPLPLLLIGAGIGWLMMGGGSANRDGHVPARRPVSADGDWPRDDGPSFTDRASSAATTAKERVGEAATGLRDSIAGAVESAGQALGNAYVRDSDAAGSMADGTSDTARHARDRAAHLGGDAGQGMRNGMGWLVSEQPLVLGALGLAVGAAVGALLPGTEAEDRLMGETRDRLVGQARETAEQGYERVKETAGEHLDQAKQRLDEGGFSPDRIGEALTDTARQLKEAVTDVARDAAGQAKGTLDADRR